MKENGEIKKMRKCGKEKNRKKDFCSKSDTGIIDM